MVSTSGSQLLAEAATKTLIHELLPVAYLVTPNIPEANLIMREAGKPESDVQDLAGLKKLATAILEMGPEFVLLKGGHLPLTKTGKVAQNDNEKEIVANVLVGRDGAVEVVEVPYQASKNTHGTGCSLACELSCNFSFTPVGQADYYQPQSPVILQMTVMSREP
jgi:hydroxymethylpyrimidine/phosphomethylpyrimidine kinase